MLYTLMYAHQQQPVASVQAQSKVLRSTRKRKEKPKPFNVFLKMNGGPGQTKRVSVGDLRFKYSI